MSQKQKERMMKNKRMMKITALFFGMVSFCFLLAGCGSKNISTPEWLDEMPPEDCIWGIGIAKDKDEGIAFFIAEERARIAVAQQLIVNLKLSDANTKLETMHLVGSTPIKRFRGPDGTWWCRVEIRKLSAKAAISNVFDSEAAQYAEFKAQQALELLDAQLNNSETE
jgi:hypothetical protein